ncbi:beta-glucosidase 11 [Cajanus cajan]|uniref:beta-glucosidase 11 n=1 Tax=Cajanus cajan TaxID=3821 RepID=UPI00098DB65C|nr:beta-glucosidase 11 [Cajanus cajan]
MLKFGLFQLLLVALISSSHALSKDEFPPEFLFGASTSAYQVEGAANEDGRKPSIWDTFAHNGNGNRYEGNGDVACDQYHKYKEDVQLMANMGLDVYRFSISWSRLIPDGRGQVNSKGLQYYNNLINELISHGIQPHVTLYHWDLPQTLDDKYGGWVSRRIVKDFTAYADVCFREFGDRVKYWTTVNEANACALGGYEQGSLPPQRCSPSFKNNCSRGNSSTEPYLAAHHMLLAHASAFRLYEKKYKDMQHGFIGFNLITYGLLPLSNTSEDISATKRAQEFYIGWFLNPFTFGDYPDIMKKNAGWRLPSFTQKDSNLVKGSIDFVGINFYYTHYVKNSPGSLGMEDASFSTDMAAELLSFPLNDTYTEIPITTWSLQAVLDLLENSYGNIPIFIHENGQKTPQNSSLEDWPRVKYLHAYVGSMLDALRSGSHVKGYFVWSLLDSFELLSGYESTFGLYHVDMNDPSLRRQPKLSAQWYSNFLNGRSLDPMVTTEIEIKPMLSHTRLLHHAA